MPEYIPVLTPVVTERSGPFSVSELVRGFPDKWDPQAPHMAKRIRSALDNIPGCYRSGRDTYVYLPLFRTGARMLQPLIREDTGTLPHALGPSLIWLEELRMLLNPLLKQDITVTVQLEGGPKASLRVTRNQGIWPDRAFDQWLVHQHEQGASALEFHCLDGRTGRFGVRAGALALDARVAANALLLSGAIEIGRTMRRDIMVHELAGRLLAQGVYHGTVPPAPLAVVLFQPGQGFRLSGIGLAYQPQSAALRKRLGALAPNDVDPEWFFQVSGGLGAPEPEPAPEPPEEPPGSVQITVTLYGASRTLQLDLSHSLEDLHYAILGAFEWDDDHLWAFFPDRKDYSLAFGPEGLESDTPPAYEVSLGSLVATGIDQWLYVFDFGDNHEFACRVSRRLPDVRTPEPLVVASRGESPSQYPDFQDDIGEEGWE